MFISCLLFKLMKIVYIFAKYLNFVRILNGDLGVPPTDILQKIVIYMLPIIF